MKKNRKPVGMTTGQYYKKNTRSSLLEVCDALSIGKIRIGFRTYDTTKPVGQRETQAIDIYMDARRFLLLAFKLKTNAIKKALDSSTLPAFEDYGGSMEKGVCICRRLSIERSTKENAMAFHAVLGPGKQTATGGVVFAGKAEKSITVPLSYDESIELALMGELMIQSFSNYCMQNRYEEKPNMQAPQKIVSPDNTITAASEPFLYTPHEY